MNDLISRQAAVDAICTEGTRLERNGTVAMVEIKQWCVDLLEKLPSVEPERLTDDDFETIRIHLNAYKEKLCNQRRWEEAEEYQRIIDRFMSFASAESKRKKGKWIVYESQDGLIRRCTCSECGFTTHGKTWVNPNYCPKCGAEMRGEQE